MKKILCISLLLISLPVFAEESNYQQDLELIRLGKKVTCNKYNIDKSECAKYINYETNLLILDELRKLNSRTDVIMNNSNKN